MLLLWATPCPRELEKRPIRCILVIAALVTILLLGGPRTAMAAPETPRSYTQQLAAQEYGWTGYQWDAIDQIVRPESGWNPCARYPGRSECGYQGSNSCGIPQANPCPTLWRGRLDRTWKAQCRWLLDYIKGRYGTPANALAYRRYHNSY